MAKKSSKKRGNSGLRLLLLTMSLSGVLFAILWTSGILPGGLPSSASNAPGTTPPPTQLADATQPSTPTPPPKPAPPAATLSLLLPGTRPAHMDEVLAEFEKRTRDTLNLGLQLTFVPWAEYEATLIRDLEEEKQYDIVYDAPGIGLNTRLAQGAYHALDTLLDSGAYTNLATVMTPAVRGANALKGKNYTVPLVRELGEVYGIALRGDLRKQYGLGELQTLEDLEEYFKKAHAENKSRTTLLLNGIQEGGLLPFEREFQAKRQALGVYRLPLSEYLWADVLLDDSKQQVQAVSIADFASKRLKEFPEGYAYMEKSDAGIAARWTEAGYLTTRSLSEVDKWEAFYSGAAASIVLPLSEYEMVARTMALRNPGVSVEFFVPDDAIRAGTPASLPADGRALHHLGLLVTSPQPSRALAFLDWLWADAANHDLFAYGIEGTDWVADGEAGWKRPEGVDESHVYHFLDWTLTANPLYARTRADTPQSVRSARLYARKPEALLPNPFAGFTFDSAPVFQYVYRIGPPTRYALTTVQLAQVSGAFSGVVDRIDQKYQEMGDREAFRSEVRTQAQDFLSKK